MNFSNSLKRLLYERNSSEKETDEGTSGCCGAQKPKDSCSWNCQLPRERKLLPPHKSKTIMQPKNKTLKGARASQQSSLANLLHNTSASNQNSVHCYCRITVALALSSFSEWSELNSRSKATASEDMFYFTDSQGKKMRKVSYHNISKAPNPFSLQQRLKPKNPSVSNNASRQAKPIMIEK
ncbi:hypothetical protein D5086_007125 [Populus alba]|uniref:Uncharacterized protein n=1 Tax=Populus alba TaxID=43335 RepID=A0ACC4CMQ7_POPAL